MHRRFLHGAGFWSLQTRREHHRFHTTMGQWYRSCMRPLLGISCRGLTDDEVWAALVVLSPCEILRLERCRLVLTAARFGRGPLWIAMQASLGWANTICSDARMAFQGAPAEGTCLLSWAADKLATCQADMRAYRRACLRNRAAKQDAVLDRVKWLDALHASGGLSFQIKPGTVSEFTCHICGVVCLTRASLASHRSRVHGELGMASTIQGTCCQRCGVEHWTTPRLRQHLRKRRSCLHSYLGSDLDYVAWEHSDQQALARRPAVKVSLARPFWFYLDPVPDATPATAQFAQHLCLSRHLALQDPAMVFRAFVLESCQQSCPPDAFETLLSEVHHSPEGRAPALGAIVKLAQAVAQAAPTSACQVFAEGCYRVEL